MRFGSIYYSWERWRWSSTVYTVQDRVQYVPWDVGYDTVSHHHIS